MDHKSGDIHFSASPTKLAKSAAVMVGFEFGSGCYFTLKGLECGNCACSKAPYSSALMYAVFRAVQARITQTYADELNSQITNLECNYQNGEFSISAQCPGTVSGIRKAISGILKNLKPAAIYPAYKDAVKQLSESCEEKLTTDRKIFNHLSNEMCKNINKGLNVLISGRANMTKEKFGLLAEACAKKLSVIAPKLEKDELHDPKEKVESMGSCLAKCKGFDAIMVLRYLQSKMPGVNLYLVDNCIFGSAKYESMVKKLNNSDAITRHVGSKYVKFKEDLTAALVYLATVHHLVDIGTLRKFSKEKTTGASIVASIKACL